MIVYTKKIIMCKIQDFANGHGKLHENYCATITFVSEKLHNSIIECFICMPSAFVIYLYSLNQYKYIVIYILEVSLLIQNFIPLEKVCTMGITQMYILCSADSLSSSCTIGESSILQNSQKVHSLGCVCREEGTCFYH